MSRFVVSRFVVSRLSSTRPELEGRVVLLTGATSGVGFAAATEFAARGATLTIVGRNTSKTELIVEILRRATGNPAIDCLIGDLAVVSEMNRVVTEFRERRTHLDVLVNNAGAMFRRTVSTSDGLEMSFALNYLAYFVITTELFDLLQNTPAARVVNTASSSYKLGRLDLGQPELDRMATRQDSNGFRAYCDSKLADVVFTRELARRLGPFGSTANCLHPGFTRSRLFEQQQGPFAYLARSGIASRFARTPEKAADTLVWLATSPEAGSHSGEYFVNRVATPVGHRAGDPELGSRLWTFSEQLKHKHAL